MGLALGVRGYLAAGEPSARWVQRARRISTSNANTAIRSKTATASAPSNIRTIRSSAGYRVDRKHALAASTNDASWLRGVETYRSGSNPMGKNSECRREAINPTARILTWRMCRLC